MHGANAPLMKVQNIFLTWESYLQIMWLWGWKRECTGDGVHLCHLHQVYLCQIMERWWWHRRLPRRGRCWLARVRGGRYNCRSLSFNHIGIGTSIGNDIGTSTGTGIGWPGEEEGDTVAGFRAWTQYISNHLKASKVQVHTTNVSSKDVLATGEEENENEDAFVDWLQVTFLAMQKCFAKHVFCSRDHHWINNRLVDTLRAVLRD